MTTPVHVSDRTPLKCDKDDTHDERICFRLGTMRVPNVSLHAGAATPAVRWRGTLFSRVLPDGGVSIRGGPDYLPAVCARAACGAEPGGKEGAGWKAGSAPFGEGELSLGLGTSK